MSSFGAKLLSAHYWALSFSFSHFLYYSFGMQPFNLLYSFLVLVFHAANVYPFFWPSKQQNWVFGLKQWFVDLWVCFPTLLTLPWSELWAESYSQNNTARFIAIYSPISPICLHLYTGLPRHPQSIKINIIRLKKI